ncbi:MAG TPA: 2-phospho-L-lactate guanylyltransferase [Candidatus Nanopelagicaceae bacterium]|nr:2-phospho-L-lactate guanylyltransferase [Candidatus Nanopelagicaceae bacterium]
MRTPAALRPFLVIPVKPAAGSKQRLALRLSDGERRMLSLSLAIRVVGLAAVAWPADQVVVVGSEPQLLEFCARVGVAAVPDLGAGQTAAVRAGAQWAVERGANVLATVAADLPGVTAADLTEVLRIASRLRPGSVAVFPDRDGSGTNGLVVRPASLQVHAFGPGSRRRHQRIARSLGLHFSARQLPGLAWDIDRPEDLEPGDGTLPKPHPVLPWARSLAPVPVRSRAARSGSPEDVR